MERRKTPRRDWVVGKDDTGRAVLEWKIDSRTVRRGESDPLARTYDLLKRLDVPHLELEDDKHKAETVGRNPYDSGFFPRPRHRRR